jgi:AbrB family looped-hinge helix DNA binding protein
MSIAKITSRGRVTLPKAVRTSLGISAGDRFAIVPSDYGFVTEAAPCDPACGIFKGRRVRHACLTDIKKAVGEMGSKSVT